MENRPVIYIAAALFNSRETCFNSLLVEALEEKGYETRFPQRDGFEFGNLTKKLSRNLEKPEIETAIQHIIYLLDMGKFLPESDIILANLDEPQDEGVIAEITYGKLMGKTIIGYRTDVRSPYGEAGNEKGGIHNFPLYQCHKFISFYMLPTGKNEREAQLKSFTEKIHKAIEETNLSQENELPAYVKENPEFNSILEGASLLFKGINNLHSEEGLKKITERYIKNKDKLKEKSPLIL